MATSRLVPDMMFAGSLLGAAGYYFWMQGSTVVEAKEGGLSVKLKPTLSGEHCMGFESAVGHGLEEPARQGSQPPSSAFSAAAMSAAASLAPSAGPRR